MTAYKITVAAPTGQQEYDVTAPTVAAAMMTVAADSPRDPGTDDLDHPRGSCVECDRVRTFREMAES